MPFHTLNLGQGGPPLVLLHGFGASLESLKPLGELLAENREVILIDLPGFGKSPFQESLISAREMADALSDFLQARGLQKVDLLGHSFGGKVAMMLASAHPERVRKLILVAASGLKRQRGLKEFLRYHSVKKLGKLIKTYDRNLFETWFTPRFASSDYKHFPHVRKILVKSINENVDAAIIAIHAPALLLWGALDQETPLDMGYRLQKMIKGAHIVVYETLDHKPFKDVGRHLMKEHIERFLAVPC